jgi:uncharacterized membrane protein
MRFTEPGRTICRTDIMNSLGFWKALLTLHILGGIAACVSGALAMTFSKGSARHRVNGNVFVISMLTLGLSASYLSVLRSDVGNFIAGLFVIYLISTAWLTARSPDGGPQTGLTQSGHAQSGLTETRLAGVQAALQQRPTWIVRADWIAFAAAAFGGAALIVTGVLASFDRRIAPSGPAASLFVLAAIVWACARGDYRMIRNGGLSGTARIARHLWRMSVALFIASGSFFFARQRIIFPAAVNKAGVPILFLVLPLALMWYWLRRIKRTREFQRAV